MVALREDISLDVSTKVATEKCVCVKLSNIVITRTMYLDNQGLRDHASFHARFACLQALFCLYASIHALQHIEHIMLL